MSKVNDNDGLLKMDSSDCDVTSGSATAIPDEEEMAVEPMSAKKRGRPRKVALPMAVAPVVEEVPVVLPAIQEACLLMRLEAWGTFIKAIEGLPFKEVQPVFKAMESLWVVGQSVTIHVDPAVFTPRSEG